MCDNKDNTADIIIEYGDLNGKHARKVVSVYSGKNIGKKNETTPLEQAIKDAEGRILKKEREGYKTLETLGLSYSDVFSLNEVGLIVDSTTLDIALPLTNTDKTGAEKPMKCQPYFKDDKVTPRINFPCYAQPKINGFRCVNFFRIGETDLFGQSMKAVFKSKEGLVYTTLGHIEQDMLKLRKLMLADSNFVNILEKYNLKVDDLVFDVEMFIKNELLETISSAVKKLNANTPRLKFYIFDLAIPKLTQEQRLVLLKQIFTLFGGQLQNVVRVINKIVNNNNEAIALGKQWIQEGYEGGVYRDPKAEYAFGKRPRTITKYKEKDSAEFTILDIYDSPNNPGVPTFLCQNNIADNTFEVVIKGELSERKQYLIDRAKHIGKKLSVEFGERTKDLKPFHAVGLAIRDYE